MGMGVADRETEGVRFRLGSLTPELLSGDFPDRVAALPSVVPHFHLSIQSGCDTILRAMRRRYNTAQVLRGMTRLRALYPRVRFTCDLMVGFPGETDDLYQETVAFLRQARFMDMHIFIYSPRPDTVAAALPDRVPPDVSHARSKALAALRDEIQLSLYRETVAAGEPIPVLFETSDAGVCYGHADDYSPVRVPSDTDLHAQLCLVRPLAADGEGITGEIVG